jgi:transposase InsO family protein
VPERSLDRIIQIAEQTKLVEPGVLRRSTVHRVLQREGISARPVSASDRTDLDRFEALAPNDLWQSDMLQGPWLPDPKRPGKSRRAYLYAFLDDHSRLLLHGRFSFKGDLPALELVFRRCLQKYGKCKRAYYDNGKVYRSGHMRHIVATVGIQGITFTQTYRPMGHGKIEALNRLIRSAFLAELKASKVTTLDELNEAFVAFMDVEYNRRVHSETGQEPLARWRAGIERVEYIDERKLQLAFRWCERRTPDKTGLFSLFGPRYQVGPELARKRIDVYFDPEDLSDVEVHRNGAFIERCIPFEVQQHRRPRPKIDDIRDAPGATASTAKPVADWLGHLVQQRRNERLPIADNSAVADARRRADDDALVALLEERLDSHVFDEATAREFLHRYGPFEPEHAVAVLDEVLRDDRSDHHINVYLRAIRGSLR